MSGRCCPDQRAVNFKKIHEPFLLSLSSKFPLIKPDNQSTYSQGILLFMGARLALPSLIVQFIFQSLEKWFQPRSIRSGAWHPQNHALPQNQTLGIHPPTRKQTRPLWVAHLLPTAFDKSACLHYMVYLEPGRINSLFTLLQHIATFTVPPTPTGTLDALYVDDESCIY